jgi:hypothetical protein
MAAWKRARLAVSMDTRGVRLSGLIPIISLRSEGATGKLRVGLWAGDTRVAGWMIPFIPENTIFTIRDGQATAIVNGEMREVPVFLRDWDGERWPRRRQTVPAIPLVLTLDQEPDRAVRVLVDVSSEAVE